MELWKKSIIFDICMFIIEEEGCIWMKLFVYSMFIVRGGEKYEIWLRRNF